MSNSINSLPTGPLATIGSFLSERDLSPNFSVANKAFDAAAKDARLIYHYPEIQSFEPNSYLGRIARQPLMDTDEGRIELVRRVRQIAKKDLGANLNILKDVDWQTLGINKNTPVSDFSYRQINMAATIIRDRFLLRSIVRIPTLHGLIQVGNSLSQNAAILRDWLANIPNDFDPVQLGEVLYEAARIRNLEIVQGILQSGRAIYPQYLDLALSKAAEIRHPGMVQAILQSGRAIDPDDLGMVLFKAAEIEDPEMVQTILQSEHVITPEWLGKALLHCAAENGNPEIVQAILQSGRAIDPNYLGMVLLKAVMIGDLEMVQIISEKSGHKIYLVPRIAVASKLISIGQLSNSLNLFWKCPIYLKPLCALGISVGSSLLISEKVINLATSILEKCRARPNDDSVFQDLFSDY